MRRTLQLHGAHAFVRPPLFHLVPSTGPNGVVINRAQLMQQFREFYLTMQQSLLVDKLHVMSERGSFESIRTADQLVSVGGTVLGMPFAGIEHRVTEFMETMRYIRAAGGPTTVASYLQDLDDCRCHSGDIVLVPRGLTLGLGPRTNREAHDMLSQLFSSEEQYSEFSVIPLEQESDAPPLGDYFGFAGSNTIIAWSGEHGMLAVDQFQSSHQPQGEELPEVVYIEPGCNFFSFYGIDMTQDIVVQHGYEKSIQSLVAAGLNPIPVQWSEMDKMGISMRSAVLLLRIAKQSTANILPRARIRSARWQTHQLPERK